MNYHIREANNEDISAIVPMMPRLANFELPEQREPIQLWESDALLLQRWGQGQEPNVFVHIAVDESHTLLGATMTTMRPELLSHEPSAHLEVLVVAAGAEGQGIGSALITQAEEEARQRGAKSITLHVFGNNRRARHLYQQVGYNEELIRCIKHFS